MEKKSYNQSPLSVSVLTVLGDVFLIFLCCKIVLEVSCRINVVLRCFLFSFRIDLNVLSGKLGGGM